MSNAKTKEKTFFATLVNRKTSIETPLEVDLVGTLDITKITWPEHASIYGNVKSIRNMQGPKGDLVELDLSKLELSEVGDNFFACFPKLTRIALPASLVSIGFQFLAFCPELLEINLRHTKISVIPDGAFYACPKLELVQIPEDLEALGYNICGKSPKASFLQEIREHYKRRDYTAHYDQIQYFPPFPMPLLDNGRIIMEHAYGSHSPPFVYPSCLLCPRSLYEGAGLYYLKTFYHGVKPVIVKLFPDYKLNPEKLLREMELACLFGEDPYFAKNLTNYRVGNDLYICTDGYAGKDIYSKFFSTPKLITEDLVRYVMFVVLASMFSIHKRKHVHGGLSLLSIIYDELTKTALIGDFGIQYALFPEANSGFGNSTRYYASPEKLCDGPIDEKTDIWSAGAIFLDLLAKKPMFWASLGDIPSAVSKAIQVVGITPEDGKILSRGKGHVGEYIAKRFGNVDKTYPGQLAKLNIPHKEMIAKMLSIDPAKRPSAEELLLDPFFDLYRLDINHVLSEEHLPPKCLITEAVGVNAIKLLEERAPELNPETFEREIS